MRGGAGHGGRGGREQGAGGTEGRRKGSPATKLTLPVSQTNMSHSLLTPRPRRRLLRPASPCCPPQVALLIGVFCCSGSDESVNCSALCLPCRSCCAELRRSCCCKDRGGSAYRSLSPPASLGMAPVLPPATSSPAVPPVDPTAVAPCPPHTRRMDAWTVSCRAAMPARSGGRCSTTASRAGAAAATRGRCLRAAKAQVARWPCRRRGSTSRRTATRRFRR